MTTPAKFGKNLLVRASKTAALIIDFISNHQGYLEMDLILVTPNKAIFAITIYHGREDHSEVKYSQAVKAELEKQGYGVIRIEESIQIGLPLKKTAGFNRRNVSGWSQTSTTLKAIDVPELDIENERLLYLTWKSDKIKSD